MPRPPSVATGGTSHKDQVPLYRGCIVAAFLTHVELMSIAWLACVGWPLRLVACKSENVCSLCSFMFCLFLSLRVFRWWFSLCVFLLFRFVWLPRYPAGPPGGASCPIAFLFFGSGGILRCFPAGECLNPHNVFLIPIIFRDSTSFFSDLSKPLLDISDVRGRVRQLAHRFQVHLLTL